MRGNLRPLGYLAVSALLHAGVALALLLAADPLASRADLGLVWLDLDNQLGPPAPAEPPPAPEAPAPPKPAGPDTVAGAKPKPKPKPPKRAPRLERMDLAQGAPGDAALTLAVRCDYIRSSPYKAAVGRLLEVFYDHRMLLWSTHIDPLRDFDALLIATPNPYRITRTFLAIRHHLPRPALREALETAVHSDRGELRWTTEGADWIGHIPSPPRLRHDRRILIEREGLLLLVEPRLRAQLAKGGGAQGSRARALIGALMAVPANGADADAVDPAGRPREAPSSDPALIVDARNLSRLVRLPAGVPTPRRLRLTLPASSPTQLHGRAWLPNRADARRFYDAAQSRLSAGRGSILALMLGLQPLLSRIRLSLRGSQVHARLRLSATELSNLLVMFRNAIPQVSIPGMGERVVGAPALPRAGPGGSKGPITDTP